MATSHQSRDCADYSILYSVLLLVVLLILYIVILTMAVVVLKLLDWLSNVKITTLLAVIEAETKMPHLRHFCSAIFFLSVYVSI